MRRHVAAFHVAQVFDLRAELAKLRHLKARAPHSKTVRHTYCYLR